MEVQADETVNQLSRAGALFAKRGAVRLRDTAQSLFLEGHSTQPRHLLMEAICLSEK